LYTHHARASSIVLLILRGTGREGQKKKGIIWKRKKNTSWKRAAHKHPQGQGRGAQTREAITPSNSSRDRDRKKRRRKLEKKRERRESQNGRLERAEGSNDRNYCQGGQSKHMKTREYRRKKKSLSPT